MRHIELSVRPETREPVLAVLDAEGIDYTAVPAEDENEYVALVSFALPKNAVEAVFDELRDAGFDEENHAVVVTADTVISRKFGALKGQYANLEDDRLARDELYAQSEELLPTVPVYVTMTLLSAVVATAGLLLDSAAVVVGSMVIAPLIGPALAGSVGTVLNEDDLFWTGMGYQALGIAVAILGAAAFAWLSRSLFLVPPGIDIVEIDEVSERILPNLLSLFVAFGAGIAGVVSLSAGISVAIVGVMIAAALIPPAAAAGIAIAWGVPTAAIGSITLVFVNLLGVNVMGLLTLWIMGYRPEIQVETRIARHLVWRRIALFALGLLTLSTVLLGVTWGSYQTATLENDVRTETKAVLESPEYEGVALVEIELVFQDELPIERDPVARGLGLDPPEHILITVEQPIGDKNPGLAAELDDRIADRTDVDTTVHVRFVEYETS